MSYDPMFPTTKGILRKLGGDKISGNVLTWDGDTSGAIEVLGEWFVKIYNKYMDLSKVASVHVVDTVGASFSETVPSESLVVQTINEDDVKGIQTLMAIVAEEETWLLVSIPAWGAAGHPEGVYVFAGKSLYRAETITFADTIVPIDPVYLAPPTIDCTNKATSEISLELGEEIKARANAGLTPFVCVTSIDGITIYGQPSFVTVYAGVMQAKAEMGTERYVINLAWGDNAVTVSVN